MKVSVLVKPNSKKEGVTESAGGVLIVRVNAPPIDGKANDRVIAILAKHFKVSKSSVELVHGAAGKKKIFKIG